MVDSQGIENGVKEPLKQKRYRKLNSKKTTSVYRGVTKSDSFMIFFFHFLCIYK